MWSNWILSPHGHDQRDQYIFFLDLICFSFFTWFATYDVPKTGTEFGQKSKNCGHCHKDPALKSTKIQFTIEQGFSYVLSTCLEKNILSQSKIFLAMAKNSIFWFMKMTRNDFLGMNKILCPGQKK